ncbi:UbiA family prenyltransferase [Georgenia alba]|uniref:UbiA family prenyltransferase n=1 Tax=Georgenia alba TaxID=2233858 RepID=A0ABW2Q232_9MICO
MPATVGALARACHPAPTAAVTALAALVSVAAGHGPGGVVTVTVAVLLGQLSIGWSNDLLDADRDRRVGRSDKPVATGELTVAVLRAALIVAAVLCVVTSAALGLAAGVVHVLLLVGSGWAYNLVLKRTVLSWLPYVVAFGALPAVAWLALDPPTAPPGWTVAVGSLLGLGAHLVNVLPDLEDDAATGIRGLPHRLGARASAVLAVAVLTAGSAVAVLGPGGPVPVWAWVVLAGVVALAVAGLVRAGRAPFRAALVIAVVNVVVLLVRA